MAFPSTLNELPNGIAALSLIADFDRCFLNGFANLDQQHQQTLNALQRVFTGTPLQQPLCDSCAAIQRHEFVERHFAVLAAVRAAMQGSLFDTLQQQARSVLERTEIPEAIAQSEPAQQSDRIQVWLESVRNWLMEIALVGYVRLDASTLIPFMTTLEQIQAEPLLMRQAALLTGFFNELMGQVLLADSSTIPIYRWVDLWTQAMVGALRPTVPYTPKLVSGTLELLGLDLRHHANLVSFTAYGLLTNDAQVQLVRVTLSAYKVDAISGDEIWLLFPDAALLLDALVQNKALHLKDIPLLPTGDLLWHGDGQIGGKYNLMKKAAECFAPNISKVPAPCLVSPSDRHPIQLAEPIFLSDYTIIQNDGTLTLSWQDAGVLPVAMERISLLSEVTVDAIAHSSQLFGLLRFDAGHWAVQPLAVTVQNKVIFTGQKAAKILKAPPKTSTVATLQERASRLLRKR
ncbi:MAG: hypothetical protein KME08_15905 [Aphanothece sp. CMT-3BRIN-NPC111]|jgi:hypothetical protein|nr:hypothetical protein [Aphanothece sp. CMT-3BRIN-NPC111]